jgi:phosphoribosyl 1,2-cyclic phosphate phosphodiesterase
VHDGAGADSVHIVIDTGPEFRLQAVRARIPRLDAVLYTHSHADHLHGIDDLRAFSWNGAIPVYANDDTLAEIRERFAFVFRPQLQGGGNPHLELRSLKAAPVRIGRITVTPIPVKHGILDILGYRIDNETSAAAYLTDTSAIPESSLPLLQNLHTLIIGGLRARPHETHFSFSQALDAAAELRPHRVYITHICHEHSHREIERIIHDYIERSRLPIAGQPAVDDLLLELP